MISRKTSHFEPAGRAAAVRSSYRLRISPTRSVELRYNSGHAELILNDKLHYRTSNFVRLNTDDEGTIRYVVGIGEKKSDVVLDHVSQRQLQFSLQPNASRKLP